MVVVTQDTVKQRNQIRDTISEIVDRMKEASQEIRNCENEIAKYTIEWMSHLQEGELFSFEGDYVWTLPCDEADETALKFSGSVEETLKWIEADTVMMFLESRWVDDSQFGEKYWFLTKWLLGEKVWWIISGKANSSYVFPLSRLRPLSHLVDG